MSEEKNTAKEMQVMRGEIAEVLRDHGFTNQYGETGRVSMLTKDGFNLSGPFGARYSRKGGLIIWNKSTRNTGDEFSVSQLTEFEHDLARQFYELTSTGRLK